MATFNITLPEQKEPTQQEEKAIEENPKDIQEHNLPELNVTDKANTEEELAKKKLVVMDGSVARIYEKALNIVYAKEPLEKMNITKESHAIDAMLDSKYKAMLASETPANSEVELYVYATDTEDMKLNLNKNISAISTLLKKKGSKDLYVAVESVNNTLNKETLIFANYCNSKNCKLFTNKDKCLRSIISKCRG